MHDFRFIIAPAEESLCGNGRIDPGEECDEGFWGRVELKPDSGLTSCCTAECTLKAGATCRYVEFVGESVAMDVLPPGRSMMRDSGVEWNLNLTVDSHHAALQSVH